MNLMSAPVYCTCDRSVACSALITWLDWPGAPGWTIGGLESGGVARSGCAVRHAPAATVTRSGRRGKKWDLKVPQGYTGRRLAGSPVGVFFRWSVGCAATGRRGLRSPKRAALQL